MSSGFRIRPMSREQVLVLRAALAPGSEAHKAWAELLGGSSEIPPLDQGSFRLLPLVYRHLGETGQPFEGEGILRGIYRQAWYRNQMAAAAAGRALSALVSAGIEPMLLKGWATVQLGYGEAGRRPMNDADMLVRPRHFDRACEALEAEGFRALSGVGRSRRGRRTFHAVAFQDASGIDIDLHHHMLEEGNWARADAGLWERSSAGSLSDVPLRVPAPEDLLINVCVHGVRWDPVPPIRWIADSVTILRAQPVDWQLLTAEADRRGVSLAMEAALREVSVYEPVPEDALARLAAARRGWLERRDFAAQQAGSNTSAMVVRYITRFLRLTARKGAARRAAAFPVFLQGMWELDSVRQVPREGLRRLKKRRRGEAPQRGSQAG